MAIYIRTHNPQRLLDSINKAIDNKDIVTWSRDDEGDYTIEREQWKFNAWMRPRTEEGRLIIAIVQSRKYPLTTELYGVYHGRFVSTIVAHFSNQITHIEVSPNPDSEYDVFEEGN